MESNIHTMANLFTQLGLSSTPDGIQKFIAAHRPIPNQLALHEAAFWSEAQSVFLREKNLADDDWSGVIDSLNVALRAI